jgi:hypothetical protein
MKSYIHADLRKRRLEKRAQPFSSSMSSVLKMYPSADDVILISTEGWENPGPLAFEPEE